MIMDFLDMKAYQGLKEGYWLSHPLMEMCILTLVMLEIEYSALEVNILPDDALVPKVARASAGMVLAV